jgi:hypothetical protein
MSDAYNIARAYSIFNPVPPRVWSRVQNQCTYVDSSNNADYQSVFIPVTAIPSTQQPMSLAEANYQEKLLYKGNILQHKANSSRLTKKQKYTQLAKGFGPNRTKVFATQTQTYTNPNTTGMQRVNSTTYTFPNTLVGKPNNISGPFQYDVPNPNGCLKPDGNPVNSIQDGGTLICGTYADPCTGELIKANTTSAEICNPASASDVPGSSYLCWNRTLQTWFPRQRYVMNNSGTKWPEGYKGFIRENAPVLTLLSSTESTATLMWTYVSDAPVSEIVIYNNFKPINIVGVGVTVITVDLAIGRNCFTIISISNGMGSKYSNTIVMPYRIQPVTVESYEDPDPIPGSDRRPYYITNADSGKMYIIQDTGNSDNSISLDYYMGATDPVVTINNATGKLLTVNSVDIIFSTFFFPTGTRTIILNDMTTARIYNIFYSRENRNFKQACIF